MTLTQDEIDDRKRWDAIAKYHRKHIIWIKHCRKVLRECRAKGLVDVRRIDTAIEHLECLVKEKYDVDYWLSKNQGTWDNEELKFTFFDGCPTPEAFFNRNR